MFKMDPEEDTGQVMLLGARQPLQITLLLLSFFSINSLSKSMTFLRLVNRIFYIQLYVYF